MILSHHIVDVSACLAAMRSGQNRPETPWDMLSQSHGPNGGQWTVVGQPLLEDRPVALNRTTGEFVHIPLFSYQVVPSLEGVFGFVFMRAALVFSELPRRPRALHISLGHPVEQLEEGAHRYWFGLAFKE